MKIVINKKKRKRPYQPRQVNVLQAIKGSLPLMTGGYLTPRGWALQLDIKAQHFILSYLIRKAWLTAKSEWRKSSFAYTLILNKVKLS